MLKIIVLLIVVDVMEVFAKHNHHLELLEDSYHHHLNDEIRQADAGNHQRRSVILEKLTSRLKNMRRVNTHFEGCCEGLDPLMFQEVRELVNKFGTSWEEIIQKYNMKQLNEFTSTLDTITKAISNVKQLFNGLRGGESEGAEIIPQPSLIPLSNDEIEYNELEADGFDENDESDFDENEDVEDESNESELNEYETDGAGHVLLSPPNANLDLNPILSPLSLSPDSFEKEYLDDSAVINDYELAINELNQKIKTLGKDLESAKI
ncbi:unnamed protein product [Diamesa tonsa]